MQYYRRGICYLFFLCFFFSRIFLFGKSFVDLSIHLMILKSQKHQNLNAIRYLYYDLLPSNHSCLYVSIDWLNNPTYKIDNILQQKKTNQNLIKTFCLSLSLFFSHILTHSSFATEAASYDGYSSSTSL